MQKGPVKKFAIAAGGLVVVAILWSAFHVRTTTVKRELEGGKVISLDPETRTGTLEYIHPESGQRIELSGTIPPGTEILINGEPATLEEIEVGELVTVEGRIDHKRNITVNWIHVDRESPATTPSTTAPDGAESDPAGE